MAYLASTICAPATGTGGAISLVRISGSDAIRVVEGLFSVSNLGSKPSHTLHFGVVKDGEVPLDEVLLSVFHAGNSYTGEEMVEISCHASSYIVNRLLQLLLEAGCQIAKPGEFSQRAFLNGKMDLTKAEAVADIIASHSQTQHRMAMKQLRGGVYDKLQQVRQELIKFSSLLELEVDFSEEDIEFAQRDKLEKTVHELLSKLSSLLNSFEHSNALKRGVSVVIAGKPNVGKSTLFNVLVEEEKAIVSDLPGTTRDYLEEVYTIDGVLFRFIDTAGLRSTNDDVERMGVERSEQQIQTADVLIYVFDAQTLGEKLLTEAKSKYVSKAKQVVWVANKSDVMRGKAKKKYSEELLYVSALEKKGIQDLKEIVVANYALPDESSVVITSQRHYQHLKAAFADLEEVRAGLDGSKTHDMLALHLRYAIQSIGELTGEIVSDDILGNIFSNFCIGK